MGRGWISVRLSGSNTANRPCGLAYFAGLVSAANGNIIRTVHTTAEDGSFYLRLLLTGITDEGKQMLSEAFAKSRFPLDRVEIV